MCLTVVCVDLSSWKSVNQPRKRAGYNLQEFPFSHLPFSAIFVGVCLDLLLDSSAVEIVQSM